MSQDSGELSLVRMILLFNNFNRDVEVLLLAKFNNFDL